MYSYLFYFDRLIETRHAPYIYHLYLSLDIDPQYNISM